MALDGESRTPEPIRPITVISSRTTTNIGAWNVRTMYELGKTKQISIEMKKYKLSILGISETHWTGVGQTKLSTGELLLYSGHIEEEAPHTQGVALMLSRSAQGALVRWEGHGPRIITATFRTTNRRINMNLVQCYAPTNNDSEDEKEDFYQKLQAIVQTLSPRNLIMVMGDFNAKIGSDNTGMESVMGREGVGERNENGERFGEFCASNQLVIGGSVFKHKRIHKVTWVSPDSVTENQIDHVCINRKFRRSLQDVRARRGADVASDHQLVVSKVQLKLRRDTSRQKNRRPRYDVTLLRDPSKCQEFNIKLQNRFEVLQDLLVEEESVQGRWEVIRDSVNETCKEVLGPVKCNHKEWMSQQTLKVVEERRGKKAAVNSSRTRYQKSKAQQEYTKINKLVKQEIKKDKQAYMETLADEAEEASHKGNLRELYSVIRRLSGRHNKPERPVKDKDGKAIPDNEGQRNRWKEHFEELLNRPGPQDTPTIQPADKDLPIDCSPPTKDEIRRAIMQLKTGKSAGPDGIPAEVLKANVPVTVETLYPLFQSIWKEEDIPLDWKEGYLVKLPKKGDLSQCSNYRGITLLSTPGKVFNRILLNRMKDAVDALLRDEQAGFRAGRSCVDQITTLRIIIEQSLEWNSSLYITFVDYMKAFDSVDRPTLWNLMRHYGIPQKITNIIKNSYEGMTCRVVHGGQLTDAFQVRTGVRQGCLLSPFLFLLAVDWIMKASTEGRRNGIQWSLWGQLDDLDFADDIALLSHTQQQMQDKMDALNYNSTRIGLNIHPTKTKVLRINATNANQVTLGSEHLKEVESFTYLGSNVDNSGGTDADVRVRIGKARGAFNQLKNIWRASNLSLKSKIRIFNTTVKPVLLYGAETWRTTVVIIRRIQTFINFCLRGILRIRYPDVISNQELWDRTSQQPIEQEILQRRWRWLGHTLRKPTHNITRAALSWNPQGRRKRGRPRNTWRRDLDADVRRLGFTWTEVERLAQDRPGWRNLVGGLCPNRDDRHK